MIGRLLCWFGIHDPDPGIHVQHKGPAPRRERIAQYRPCRRCGVLAKVDR